MREKTTNFNKALLSASDLAAYGGFSLAVAYKLINSEPDFPVVKINSRKYVNKDLLDKWLLEHTSTNKTERKK